MKSKLLLVIAFAAASLHAAAFDTQRRITIEGKLNCPYISHNGGIAYLQMSVTTPRLESPRRRPMNLSVVLDRSGSMGDQDKMEYAKKALFSLIDQLKEEDIFSLVIYDDVIEVLREATHVWDKRELKRQVEHIHPRGSTNLGGGMIEGFRQVERNLDKEFVNRVILLSDGLANQGITDPRELNRIARRYRSRSVSLTTMGVGLDYNENLMMGLSKHGGGNYYFIESPHGLASIMRREFDLLSTLVAQNASIELDLGRGVRVLDAIGCEHRLERDRYIIPIGNLYSNDGREFTVELQIPEGSGSFTVARGILRYEGERGWFDRFPVFAATVHYTRDVADIERNRDLETQAKVDIALSTRNVERALGALDRGDHIQASQEFINGLTLINSSKAISLSGSGGTALRAQAKKLEGYHKMLKDSLDDTRKAKKTIQYDNYQTQKNKQ